MVKRKRIKLQKKSVVRSWCQGLNKNMKRRILTALASVIKKDPTASIRKFTRKL